MLAGAYDSPRRRAILRSLPLALAVLTLTACVPVRTAPAPPPVYGPNPPVAAGDFPDPMIANTPTGFAAFATNDWVTRIPARTATSLAAWTPGPDALPTQPVWADPGSGWSSYWAPAVHQFGATWVMYFTAPHAGSGRQCIGVASATAPTGPYVPDDSGPIVCQPALGGSIDPSVFVDPAGMPWLLWKSDGNCCQQPVYLWSQRLATTGLALEPGTSPAAILGVDQAWEDGSSGGLEPYKRLVEGPAMIYDGGVYWLFYSASWWNSVNYAVGFARCTSPAGGCVKPRDGPILKGTVQGAGPGGAEVFREGSGQGWLVYHAWAFAAPSYATGGQRSMRLSRLSFANGEPVLGGGP